MEQCNKKKFMMAMRYPMLFMCPLFIFLCLMQVIDFKLDFEMKFGNLFHSRVKKCTAYYFNKLKNQDDTSTIE